MMIKYVTKTTKEYTYDKEGRISKEVITEEYSEHETNEKESKPLPDSIKKAVGVPPVSKESPPFVPNEFFKPPYTITSGDSSLVTTTTGDVVVKGNLKVEPNASAKADTNGVIHNITVNLAEKGLTPEEIAKMVNNAIRKQNPLK